MNRYSSWKYILIFFLIGLGLLFALPNIYGKDPSLQVSAARSVEISELTEFQVSTALDEAGLSFKDITLGIGNLTIRFDDEETQLKAQSIVKESLGRSYVVALNLAPATPDWLSQLGAEPMSLGLDLRGGVHFLMEVDMDAAIDKAKERYISDLRSHLRENKVRYKTISRIRGDRGKGNREDKLAGLLIRFKNNSERDKGQSLIEKNFINLDITSPSSLSASISASIEEEASKSKGEFPLILTIIEDELLEIQRLALQQNITTLRKRVNELGVAEPVIQRQGQNRVVVQLPGIQDTARAKSILGATATLEFRLVDEEHEPQDAVNGRVPAGSKLYYHRNGLPILLRKQVMLTGDSIINAASGIDTLSGGPDVTITLDGRGAKRMSRGTRDNVGKRLAVVFIEYQMETEEVDGQLIKTKETIEEVINAAVIQEQLGKRFHITGLDSTEEAKNLALLLRAGALAAPIYIIEERTVGPSLGQDNIDKGFDSVVIGFVLVLIFMAIYYKIFGLIADVALALNLVLIVAMLSLLQATLTLPGIAGIVLTVGMAVDANVLIFERIREELRNGNSPQASIHAGYQKAFSTIADANITTLIAALMLFSFGTGPIQGFAVTLSLGIICSMFTAIMVTRGLVNFIFGGKNLKKLTI